MVEQRIHEIIKQISDQERFSGVVLVQKGDDVLLHRAYGYASRAWKILNSSEMLYSTASLTKMFTAAAVLQLIESGLLSLNTKVQNILKLERPAISTDITLQHLLMHTSGLPDYYDEYQSSDLEYAQLWEHRPNYSTRHLSDFLPLVPNRMPDFKPGEQFAYCNTGYIILGLLIEKIAEQSYYSYVKQNVFSKAGMRRSGFL
ncbi:beta-lactamase family protein, partial [bacterium]|nr:beta-lactamase family protein [bacterium]